MYPFIFSHNILPRLARHLTFWGLYAVCSVPLQLDKVNLTAITDLGLYEKALVDMTAFLPVYLFSVYFSIYFILPRYLATRDRSLLIWRILFLSAVSLTAGYFISCALIEHAGVKPNFVYAIGFAMHRCQANLVTITTVAVLIKIMKDDYHKQRENELLTIENLGNKLRLLKMQLQPRLLFSSLNNIYIAMEKGSPRAPRMILKLSDLLSYLLYESNAPRIALSKEVGMIRNYVQLKKLEYPDSMEINLDCSGLKADHSIPPGVLLPILEIVMDPAYDRQKPVMVDIALRTSASKVYFSIRSDRQGIDTLKTATVRATLDQVKTRLQSLVAGKFRLDIKPGLQGLGISMELGTNKPAKSR